MARSSRLVVAGLLVAAIGIAACGARTGGAVAPDGEILDVPVTELPLTPEAALIEVAADEAGVTLVGLTGRRVTIAVVDDRSWTGPNCGRNILLAGTGLERASLTVRSPDNRVVCQTP